VTALAPTLQAFFTDRLGRQRHASPQTVAAYRDTWRLLLTFACARTAKQPSALDIGDLDAPLVSAFLDHLEQVRGNSPRTRNARLAAVHSMFSYAALQHPEHAETITRVLAIPPKRFDKALVTWLTEPELTALLAAPGTATWAGRRDHAMIALAAQTGLRVSELTGLTLADVHLGTGPHVSCHGKGRNQRITPLSRTTVAVLRAWLAERRGDPAQPLFPNRVSGRLSRDAVEKRLAQHAAHRRQRIPAAESQERHRAHPAAHRRHATAARRRRHHGHRALARPRASRNNPDLPARRPRDQRKGPREDHPAGRKARTLQAPGPAPRVPRKPLIMPTFPRTTRLWPAAPAARSA